MKYRRLGKTNLNVSVVGVGTWQFGGEWGKNFTQEEVNQILGRAQQLGVNLIDTAECYGDHTSERLIGGAIRNQREKWIVATKFGHRFTGFMQRSDERSASDVRTQLEDSLRALGSDYIDIYQFHSVRDSEFANEELWKVLWDAKAAGKIRHIGNSISSNLDPRPQADASTKAQVEVLQILYNRLDRRPEEAAFPSAQKQDLGVFARVPLASGFLSGKYKPGAKFPPGDTRHEQKPEEIERKLREVERIAREEVPPNVPMAQWALAWCLKNPAVTAVIPGCKDVKQVESNAKAADLIPSPGTPDFGALSRVGEG
jgi:aryl-alcohol dehydrogenase-like predicted oxidoreductase